MKLSILMPVLNERSTVVEAIEQVLGAGHICPFELIVIDDGSTDGTTEMLRALRPHAALRIVHHARNRGKGAAVRTGSRLATGDYTLIFDADLEYDAADIPRVVEPVLEGRAHCVFGVRQFAGATSYRFRYMMGNRAMTMAANALFDCWIGDLHTCMKLVPSDLFAELELVERGFGLDTEITAKLLRHGVRPFEVPIGYSPRSHADGKKIGWRDGVACFNIMRRERFRRIDAAEQSAVTSLVRLSPPLPARASSSNVISLQGKHAFIDLTDGSDNRRDAEVTRGSSAS